MKRRDFITLLGGGAAAWPLAVRSQQAERMRRIGVLTANAANDPTAQARHAALLQSLQQLGWTEGRNLRVDARWAAGSAAETRRHARELAVLAPDVILVTGSSALGPLLEATSTVSIVFVIVPDPVGAGFIESLSRPGGQRYGLYDVRVQLECEMARAS